jgi:phosphatidylglycerophosphate synthase
MIDINELRRKYLESKAHEKGWVWTYYVRRPISFYLTIPFLYLNVSANKVTLLFMLTGIIGSLLLAIGDYRTFILGAVLIELAIILDCVDGNIARVKGKSILGNTLDTWAGEITLVLSMFMLGIGLSIRNNNLITLSIAEWFIPNIIIDVLNSNIFVYIGSISALSALSSWACKNSWRVISKNIDDIKPIPSKNSVIRMVENIFHYSGAYSITLLVFAIIDMLDIFLLLVLLVYGINLITTMYSIIRRARSLDRNKYYVS